LQHLLEALQAISDQIDVVFRSLDSASRFLLKRMHDPNVIAELNCITARKASVRYRKAISKTPEPIPLSG